MRTSFVLLALFVIYSATHAPAQPPKQRAAPTAEAVAKDLVADLREARDLLRNVADRRTRDRLELLLTRAEVKVGDLQRMVPAGGGPARPAVPTAEDFANVLKSLKAQSFDDNKLVFVEDQARHRSFTSAQARDLLKAFDFDPARVKAAVALYPRVVDPENYYRAIDVFTFDSHKREVREKLKIK